jgi:hypothetical protein
MPIDIIKPFLDLIDKPGKVRAANGDARGLKLDDPHVHVPSAAG